MFDRVVHLQVLGLSDQFIQAADTQFSHQFTDLFGEEHEVVDHMLGFSGELAAQGFVLGGNANRAGVEMAFTHHDAADSNQGHGGKGIFFGAEQCVPLSGSCSCLRAIG